jgi:hypothetical protein
MGATSAVFGPIQPKQTRSGEAVNRQDHRAKQMTENHGPGHIAIGSWLNECLRFEKGKNSDDKREIRERCLSMWQQRDKQSRHQTCVKQQPLCTLRLN